MNEVITPRRMLLRIGLFGLPLYLMMLFVGVPSVYFDAPPGRGVIAALVAGAISSFMVGISLYLILCYFKESITLYEGSVYIRHVFGARSIALGEVLRACWCRRGSSPFLKLFLRDGKEVLRFTNFPPRQCGRLIDYFHDRLPLPIQEGWNEDMQRYARETNIKESIEEFNRLFHSLWCPALAGPIGGFFCGLALHLCEIHFGASAMPKWSGSLIVDWTGIGLLIGLLVYPGMWTLRWLCGPE